MSLSDQELAELLADLESDRVERKRNAADSSKLRKTICAFANDLPGTGQPGVLFVGVEDDGRCAELPITDELLQRLAQPGLDGSILPLPMTVVQKRLVRGCDLVAIVVQPSSSPPIRYRTESGFASVRRHDKLLPRRSACSPSAVGEPISPSTCGPVPAPRWTISTSIT